MSIPDLHSPYQHKGALSFLRRKRDQLKPDLIVNQGDEADQHQVSKWAKDPEAKGHKEETLAVKKYFRCLAREFPNMELCESNHAVRPLKKALEAGICSLWVRTFHEVFDCPKTWSWAERWEHDGVSYIHGDGFSGLDAAIKAAKSLRMNTVIGHVHTHAGIQWINSVRGPIFGMGVGCMIDRRLPAFRYARGQHSWPVLGVGFIDDGIPHWLPYLGGMNGKS